MSTRMFIVSLISVFCLSAFFNRVEAQDRYKLVVVPTKSTTFSKRQENPYNISASLDSVLRSKNIPSTFQKQLESVDPCEQLYAELENVSSWLECRVKVNLRNCRNQIVWTGYGVGENKKLKEGYAEAISAALNDLVELPAYNFDLNTEKERFKESSVGQIASNTYTTSEIYYGDSYIFDVRDVSKESKEIVILNNDDLGYKKLQVVAVLKHTDASNIYSVSFIYPNGELYNGVAVLDKKKLEISIDKNGDDVEIKLKRKK